MEMKNEKKTFLKNHLTGPGVSNKSRGTFTAKSFSLKIRKK
jgi:hypothetical protein